MDSIEIISVVLLSLRVSLLATALAALAVLPAAFALALSEFRGRRAVIAVLNSFLSLPAVFIGLVVYLLLSRRGPLGGLDLLYTPSAMVIAQALLAAPILAAFFLSAFASLSRSLKDQLLALGASRRQLLLALLREGRYGMTAALVMGFSRVLGETGMTMMVGGNIRGHTRVMTTSIALGTMRGEFETSLLLGLILLAISLTLNVFFQILQGGGRRAQ
jgi:tungstate transport system permease protein